MIASTATAVLPVCRSPMMSSRWPRPIGIIASIALMPVWSGSFTGWRGAAPRRLQLDPAHRGRLDRSLAILGLAEGRHHAAEERFADRHLGDPARAADLV